MKKLSVFLCLFIIFSVGCGNNPAGDDNPQSTPTPVLAKPGLAFPFSNPDAIERIAPFGEPNWSGSDPHNGTDLIVYTTLDKTELIAPASGTISSIEIRENPYSNPANQLMVDVTLTIIPSFVVNFVIEAGTTDEATKNRQRAAVSVSVNQTVSAGDRIGDLIVGEHGYPHLHYMVTYNNNAVCAYHHSSATAKATFEAIATRSNSEICK